MTNPPVSDVPKTEKLSLRTKLAYGAGDVGAGMTSNLESWSLLIFLTNVAGLNPGIAGTVLLIGKIWDAVNDPIVGVLSDRTRSPRWGRRHSWMLYAAIPFALTFCLRWIVPNLGGEWLLFWYYVLTSILFNTAFTAVNLPYSALTAEITQDYDERTSLSSVRLAFSLGGAVLILAIALVMGQIFTDSPSQQYFVTGLICAALSLVTIYWCIWGTRARVRQTMRREEQAVSQVDSTPLPAQIRIALSNRPFLFVIGIYLCSWLALQITAAILPFFVVDWMGLDSYFQVALAVQGTAIAMLFVCNAISKRVGKRALYFMGMSLWILIQAGLFFLQPGQTALMYVLCFAASFGVATAYLVPWSMLPDVIELDELRTGQRREGVFYAFMTLLQKIGLALGLFLVGQALAIAGFIEATPGQPLPTQPESALLAIRLAIGPFPTLALILGLVLAYFYPITRETHAQMMMELRARREKQQAIDP